MSFRSKYLIFQEVDVVNLTLFGKTLISHQLDEFWEHFKGSIPRFHGLNQCLADLKNQPDFCSQAIEYLTLSGALFDQAKLAEPTHEARRWVQWGDI